MKNKRIRNTFITIFVIVWTLVFHYESTRAFYLQPLVRNINPESKPLPKLKFLFPPAGWIMFYHVGESSGGVEVFGAKNGIPQLIDPHNIFETRTFGYDNIHRGILGTVLQSHYQHSFCQFLERKFPYFDNFMITVVSYPSVVNNPLERKSSVYYRCQ